MGCSGFGERWGEHAHYLQRCLSDVHRSLNVQTSCLVTKCYYFSDRTAPFIKPCFELFLVVTDSAQCSVFGTFLFRCLHLHGIIFDQLKWERHNLELDCCWPYPHFVNLEVILPANTK